MGNKKVIIDLAADILQNYDFKFWKGKQRGVKKATVFTYELVISINNSELFFIACSIISEQVTSLVNSIVGDRYWGRDLIGILTDHALPDDNPCERKKGLYGEFYFKEQYSEMGLPIGEAKIEFERLVKDFIMPWFEQFQTLEDVRDLFRKNALNGKLWTKAWNNTDLTSRDDGSGSAFYQDVIISKLINKESDTAKGIYEKYYEKGYEEYWNKIDDDEGIQLRFTDRFKDDVARVPQMIKKLDSIPYEEWEGYRKDIFG